MNFKHRLYGNAIQQSQINDETYHKDDEYEYVYFNILERNPSLVDANGVLIQESENDKILSIDLTRSANILDGDTDNWEVACMSYSLANSFAIFYSKSQNILFNANNYYGDPLHYIYVKDTMTGNVVIQYIDYEGIDNNPKIYEYNVIIRAINNAITTICNGIGTTAPFFKINQDNIYEYWAAPLFSDIGMVNARYKLGYSYATYVQLNCFETTNDLVEPVGFRTFIRSVLDPGNTTRPYNAINWTVLSEAWDPRFLAGQYSRVIFKSDIPISNELYNSAQQISDGILIDLITIDRVANNKAFTYSPEFPRWHNMINSKGFRKFNLSVFIERNDGTLDPYKMRPYDTFFMKLCFRRPLK